MILGLANFFASANRARKALRKNNCGNVTVFFALSILPVAIGAGAAVDYQRAVSAKVEMTQAMETAAIYAANMSATTTDQARLTAVQNYVNTNYGNSGDAALSNISVDNYIDHVTVNATATIPSAFMQLAGVNSIAVPVSVEVKKSGINLEVSLVLDNTNSMNTKSQGATNTPIVDLKAAAANFVNTVLPDTQGTFYTKIALVPYNNGVNPGATLAPLARGTIITNPSTSTTPGSTNFKFTNAQNQSTTFGITNCVTERTGSKAYTDASAATYPVGRGYYGSSNNCSVTQMVPLTTDKTALTTALGNMSASNSTAGQVGIAWGWYSLSPNFGLWSGASVPAGYDKLTASNYLQKVKKIMILMTDGEYNSANCNGVITGVPTVTGSGGDADHINCAATNGDSYAQSTSVCSAIKNAGIEVYVITFQLDSTVQKRVDLVNSCATDASHILNASNSAQLDTVFRNLATSITSLYVSK
ncbi:MAG: TadE/TadG family type IV pilus assembly protein [Aestuariivirga sp.]